MIVQFCCSDTSTSTESVRRTRPAKDSSARSLDRSPLGTDMVSFFSLFLELFLQLMTLFCHFFLLFGNCSCEFLCRRTLKALDWKLVAKNYTITRATRTISNRSVVAASRPCSPEGATKSYFTVLLLLRKAFAIILLFCK